MHITVKYFGQIAEVTKRDEESLEFSGSLISELLLVAKIAYPARFPKPCRYEIKKRQ